MRKTTVYTTVIVLGLISFIVTLFIIGPRIEIDTTLRSVKLPIKLETYVADSEAAIDDIIPGTEKTIIWAGEPEVQTPLSIIYLHGFSASRQESAPLCDIVAQSLEANLFYTRFTGHGRDGKAMLTGSVNAWLNDAHEALAIGRRLGKKVIVIGMSTGGTTALWLASQDLSGSVAAFVLISPNVSLADSRSRILLWPWGGHLAEWFIGPERSWEPDNALHGKFWTTRYPTRALLPMMGMVSLANSLDLSPIDTPFLVIYSPDDHIVSAEAIENMYDKIGTAQKQLIAYKEADDSAQHVLAGDILSPGSTKVLARMILDFVHQYGNDDSMGMQPHK